MPTPSVNFDTYIKLSVKNKLTIDFRVAKETLTQLNLVINVLGDRIAKIAAGLCKINSIQTLNARSVESAVRITFVDHGSSDLVKDLVRNGVRAVTRFSSGGRGSKAKLAGIIFSPTRAEEILRNHSNRVSEYASVYLAAVLESFCIDLLENASSKALDNKRTTIKPIDIRFSVDGDDELEHFFKVLGLNISGAGYSTM